MRLGLGLGIVKSAASIYKGILDKYPNAVAAYSTRKLKTSYPTTLPADYGGGAAAAYSLRKVKSDYEGSAVKVRRSSDGGLQDIGFDSNGNLDTTTLQSFVNAEHTFVDEDFSSSTGWILGTGVSITGGVLRANTSGSAILAYKNFGEKGGQQVRVTFTISNYVSGTVKYRDFGGTVGTVRSANGTYTETLSLSETGNPNHGFFFDNSFVGDIDDFEIVQLTADGAVTKWYDQSGNDNDATNTTDSEQPLVVSGGTLVTENGKAALDFDGVDDYLGLVFSLDVTLGYTNFYVCSVNNDAKKYILASVKNSSNRYAIGVNSSGNFQSTKRTADIVGDAATYVSGQVLLSDNSTPEIYLDGNLGAASVATLNNAFSSEFMSIGKNSAPASSGQINGVFQEIILFNSDQSTNRKDIEWNINNHYSIYDQWDRKSCMNVRRSSDNATQDIGFSGKNINQTQLESFVNDASPVLDDYTGAAAAYSLRKVRSAYTGSAIRVRRSSDDTEQDIGFDANGDLDTQALLAFVNEEITIATSDFSGATPSPSFAQSNVSLSSNQSVLGVDDALKVTLSGGASSHYIYVAGITIGQEYKITFDYYIPSGQTLDYVRVGVGNPETTFNTTGEWVTGASFTQVANQTFYIFRFTSSAADGDVFYVKNIVVTQTTADGAVTTFYDQSGNGNNATNSTESEQPLIVSGGTLVTENGKAAIDYNSSGYLLANFSGTLTQPNSIFSVCKKNDHSGYFFDSISPSTRHAQGNGTWIYAGSVLNGAFPNADLGNQLIFTALFNGASSEAFIDGSLTATGDAGSQSLTGLTLGRYYDLTASVTPLNGTMQEFIVFNSDQSTNRLSIEGNIGRYYNITGYRDGFVTKWYDQSGEYNHAENSTSDEQPQIVSSGSVETLGSKVTPVRQGVTTTLDVSGVESSVTGAFTIATRFYLSSQSDLDCIFGGRGLTAGAGLCASYLSGAWRFEVVTTTGTRAIVIVSDSNTPINNWYNVIFTWDGTTDSNAVKVYLNTSSNVFTATANGTVINYDASHPMSIFNANRNSFDGGLATWDIWNSQITDIDGLFSAMEH